MMVALRMLQRHRTNRVHTYTYIYIERRREEGGEGGDLL